MEEFMESLGILHQCIREDNLSDAEQLFPALPDYRVITQISAEQYERKKIPKREMAFLPNMPRTLADELRQLPNGICLAGGQTFPFSIENTRLIRKLLQPIKEDNCLLFTGQEGYTVFGIYPIKVIEALDAAYYRVVIENSMAWSISLCRSMLWRYANGQFSIGATPNRTEGRAERAAEALCRMLHVEQETHKDIFRVILSEILNAKSGTSLLLFPDKEMAREEAQRLANSRAKRGYLLQNSVRLNGSELLNQMVDIDGGIIADADGNCYAYGCIFDGAVSDDFVGNAARGARFNSVLLYAGLHRCVGVIYSDDDTLDLYDGQTGTFWERANSAPNEPFVRT